MTFEEKMMKLSNIKESGLYAPSMKAYQQPDNGVKILNKAAYHVIKDCAMVTQKYLPIMVYGAFMNPIATLMGKFVKSEIVDFVQRSEKNIETKQFLHLVLLDVQKHLNDKNTSIPTNIKSNTMEIETDNVYGDYMIDIDYEEDKLSNMSFNINIDNKQQLIEMLCSIFVNQQEPQNDFRK
jgi:hypothetical protein